MQGIACKVGYAGDMPTVNITDPRSAGQQVADHIAAQIRAGDPAPGARLPTFAAMAAAWNTSNETIRDALDRLQASGLVSRRRGVGVFVADWEPATCTLDAPPAGTTRNTVTNLGRPADEAAAALGIDPNTWVALEDHQDTDAAGRLLARTVVTHASAEPSAFAAGQTHDIVQARIGTAVQLAHLPEGTPVLVQCRTVTDADGRPQRYSETVHNGPLTQLHIARPD